MVDPWAPGTLSPEEDPGVRWIRALSYIKGKSKNGYARPIEGIVAVVNMNEKKVARVLDTGVRPLPPQSNDLDMKAIGKQRMAPRPLLVSQPQGSSFEVNGHEVRWQKWRFRFAVHPREGLVLYSVGYEDQGRVRSVLYRAAISEMVVPYGDKAENWVFRNAFDEGEYGIGKLTDEMVVGADAPKHARFFDFVYLDDTGKMNTTSRAVALYERDGGLLWKHFEFYSNSNDSRRSRELVLSSILSVGNYDYGVNWIFRQDGSLELQGMLTGIMLAKGVPYARIEDHHEDPFAHLVAPYVAAPHHQHFFNFRLDFDVEGSGPNSVSEVNVRPLPVGDGNPHANAFVMDETVFRTEQEARRELNLESARKWIVTNPIVKNSLGHSAGYALVPGESGVPYVHPESKVRQRAGFIDHHLWVTPYEPLERHAAGEYPNQAREPDGLAKWTKQNRSIENRDVVVWYTFAVTHIPRPEEWPVMSVTTAGFKLLPVGFFSRNPALDVPK
jgi:primary-amine oxidase